MWMQEYGVVVGCDGDEIYLTKRGTDNTLRLTIGLPATGGDEVHVFDYLFALGDRLRWSADTNALLGKFLGNAAIKDLILVVETVGEVELF